MFFFLNTFVSTLIDGDRDVDFSSSCLHIFPFMSRECWLQGLVKGLGLLIIMGACFSKAPVVMNMIRSKSSTGISRGATYGDVLMCANGALYGLLEGFPFTAYGESIALTVQCTIIVIFVWIYADSSSKVSVFERCAIGISFLMYCIGIYYFLPKHLHYLLVASNWPVLIYSRALQIMENIKIQHTGSQSIVTDGISVVGGVIRIVTTIQEVGWDITVITGFGLSVFLNMTLVLQNVYYRKNTEKFLQSLQVGNDKKES